MSSYDYAHNRVAEDNRHRKALHLRAAAIDLGLGPDQLRVALEVDAGPEAATLRRRIRKLAGLDREPSRDSWVAALVELERRPPSIVGDELRTCMAPCGCWPARDTGVLYEFPPTPHAPLGWPCGHYGQPLSVPPIPTEAPHHGDTFAGRPVESVELPEPDVDAPAPTVDEPPATDAGEEWWR